MPPGNGYMTKPSSEEVSVVNERTSRSVTFIRPIVIGGATGLIAAAMAYFFWPVRYESQAKLLVRYVVERSPMDGLNSTIVPGGPSHATRDVIGTEVAILTGSDVKAAVAKRIGGEPFGSPTEQPKGPEAAAAKISEGLRVSAHKESSIIQVSFEARDPELPPRVLETLIREYFQKHLEIHRSLASFDYLQQRSDGSKVRLSQVREDLQKLKRQSGINDVAESTASLSRFVAKAEDELQAAKVELTPQHARTGDHRESQRDADAAKSPETQIGSDVALPVADAKRAVLEDRLNALHEKRAKLAEVAPQIAELERMEAQEEANQKQLAADIERARVDQALDPSKIPNIAVIEKPSQATKVARGRSRVAALLFCSGLAIGCAIALVHALLLRAQPG